MNAGGAGGSRRDEADRWLNVAEKLLVARDLEGSKQFANQALSADPLVPGADEVIAAAEVLLAYNRRRCPASSGFHAPDPYAVLGLSSSSPASRDPEMVHYHYRRLTLMLTSVPPNHAASLAFSDAARVVADAWNLLSDPGRKAFLDAHFDLAAQGEANAAAEARATATAASAASASASAPSVGYNSNEKTLFTGNSGSEKNSFQAAAGDSSTGKNVFDSAIGSSIGEKNFFDEPVLESVTPVAAATPVSSGPVKRPRGRPRGSGRGRGSMSASRPASVVKAPGSSSSGRPRGRPPGSGRGRGRGRPAMRSASPIRFQPRVMENSPVPPPPPAAEPVPMNPPPVTVAQPVTMHPPPVAPSDPDSFWTACPTCCHVHQYEKQYESKNLLCPSCKKSFFSVPMLVPPPLVPGTEMYYCSWGFFPLGYPGGPKFAEMPQFKPFFATGEPAPWMEGNIAKGNGGQGSGEASGGQGNAEGGGQGNAEGSGSQVPVGMSQPKLSKKVVAKKRVMSNLSGQTSL